MKPKKSGLFDQAMAFLALPAIAVAGYGLYWVMTYDPPIPQPPPKIEQFRVAETFQKVAGGEWTVRVEWNTINGDKVTLEPEPGAVGASGKHTYEVAAKKVITLRVRNKSGEAAHEMELEPGKQ